eukprot:scaffold16541_cov50-Phaeocystis_antarctica.AAC.2
MRRLGENSRVTAFASASDGGRAAVATLHWLPASCRGVRRRRCLGKGGRSVRGPALTSCVDASEDEPDGSVAPAREIIRAGARPGPIWKRAPRPTPATTTRPAAHDAPRLSSAFGWWQSAALARWCGCGSDARTSSSSFISGGTHAPKTQLAPKLARLTIHSQVSSSAPLHSLLFRPHKWCVYPPTPARSLTMVCHPPQHAAACVSWHDSH